jgi:hypothetical protein
MGGVPTFGQFSTPPKIRRGWRCCSPRYTAPVEIIRKKATELVAQTKHDNAKVTSAQVTNASAQAIEVRVLVNSDSAATTGNACADLREKLIAFLQQEYPQALPRQPGSAMK